jgi:AmmeMemoRadiSam system protein A
MEGTLQDHGLLKVARQAILAHLGGAPESGRELRAGRRAAVFVSLHGPGEVLRGCMGTLEPTEPDLVDEVRRVAVMAATTDPRFPPVTLQELAGLTLKVDVLSEPVAVQHPSELDPRRWGVIVSDPQGRRRGVLLPDLPGVDDVQTQLAIARRKAGLGPSEAVLLRRFEVVRVAEPRRH